MQEKSNSSQEISEVLLGRLRAFKPAVEKSTRGRVLFAGDGVAKVKGLSDISFSEMVEFSDGTPGMAVGLDENTTAVMILGSGRHIRENDTVKGTGKLLSIGVSDELIGRIIDPLGRPLDGKPKVKNLKSQAIERIAPGVVKRCPVKVSLSTGILALDSMLAIGRGQRELIIGDRGTGKTALTIDTIINQKGAGVICVYVAIGQKTSRVAQLIGTLSKRQAMDHTIIVNAGSSDPAAMQFLAPYSGCAIGEYFMDKGQDALIIYDDLTKHSWAYRQISLILKRPAGREAYPGDIFYIHSRLLERACKLSEENGGGSLTALPIIETQAGDISAYIPTNVISITDGQIFLESDLFYAGIRPAVNIGLSVSRVGGSAQIKAMKQVAGRLRLDLAQYRELSAFAQFSADLDEKTRNQIERGSRMVELLKQKQFSPYPVEEEILLLFAGTQGLLDDLKINKIQPFALGLLEFFRRKKVKLLNEIAGKKELTEEISKNLTDAIVEYKKIFYDYG